MDIKQYDGNKEVKIYSLDKRSNADTKMIINLHTCAGQYNFKLTNKIVDYDNNPNDIPINSDPDKNGRNQFLIKNLKHKHLYLSIKSAQNPQECISGKAKDSNNVTCSNELSYLIYYYSLTDKEYMTKKNKLDLSYRYIPGKINQIAIMVTPLGGNIMTKTKLKVDIEYNLFWTRNSTLKIHLDNICYLSQILNKKEGTYFNATTNKNEIFVIRNIPLNYRNEYIISNLGNDEKIYINILARNLKTNELTVYKPLEGITGSNSSILKKMMISFLVIIILTIIGYVAYNFYRENLYNDFQSPAVPKISTEMGALNTGKGGYQRISL